MPPLRWRSALLFSKTLLTSAANPGFISRSLSVTSLCTVDLLTRNFFAAALTVGLSCVGSGIAVAAGAPAAIGATSEDPKNFVKALIFVVLGEGIALYGLLIAILIISNVGTALGI